MKKFANPNLIYIATFIIPFFVYSLGWSRIYPDLTMELFAFYFITFFIAFTAWVLMDRLPGYVYKPIPISPYNIFIIAALFIFYAIDCLYMGYVPLFVFSSGAANYTREDIGIPIVHLIVVTFNAFFALYIFHQYLSNRKWFLLWQYLLLFVPFIFLSQRSSIMHTIIGSVFLFIISFKKLSFKKIFIITFFGLSALYIFGYLGNVRSSGGDATFIPRASGATEEFLESKIPKEFYWGYLYIGSPVANLQNNINIEKNVTPDFKSFAVYEMTPYTISKQLTKVFDVTDREFHQINHFLNVGTIYARAFSYLSWSGMYIIFIYMILLMNLYYLVIKQSYLFGATGIALMLTLIALANYENSLANPQYSFPLIYPFIFSVDSTFLNLIKYSLIRKLFLPLFL